jgi:Protein of unknown function (DUF2946)
MRRRIQSFLPVALLAVVLQILAPIGGSWATAAVASDPLSGTAICHGDAGAQSPDRGSNHPAGDLECLLCCLSHAGGSIDPPRMAVLATPLRPPLPIVWNREEPSLAVTRANSNAQARAPPMLS